MKKVMNNFLLEIYRCTDPAIFLGVARILKVPLDNKMTFEKIVPLMIKNFQNISKKRKQEIVKIFKLANEEEILNGSTTSNTKEENTN